jgi:putative ABC transport system permease protein
VVVIGYAIAKKLFPFVDPIGREVLVDHRKYRVVGVFDEKKSAFGGNFDNYVLMPVTTFLTSTGSPTASAIPLGQHHRARQDAGADGRGHRPDAPHPARAARRQAGEPDNFDFYNSASLITQFNKMSMGVKLAGFVIGIIALIVAGIGIMNIMLVAVTERTREIGLRKALGARAAHIRDQFLFEAVVLCNIGGVVGVLAGFALGNVVAVFTHFQPRVPLEWAVIGLVFCSVVGVRSACCPRSAPRSSIRSRR